MTELKTYIINNMIERIVVYEKMINEDGGKIHRVNIYFNIPMIQSQITIESGSWDPYYFLK
ncbi:DUF4368 domain-containing protein [Clostridium cadaveris]|uniref:DUF4368 domain-containing protein n=1 Tax=Clostridium cadaveris TaxID=1529 RepID=UPI00116084A1